MRRGHSDGDRLLAHVQTDIPDALRHGAGFQRCGSTRGVLRPPGQPTMSGISLGLVEPSASSITTMSPRARAKPCIRALPFPAPVW
jgi:hypothetical protein